MAKDLYAVLGLSRDASPEDIKKAYRRLSKEWHPDRHKGDKAAEERFKEINEAYEVLNNEEKKRMYDQFGTTGGPGFGGGPGGPGMGGFDFSGFGGINDFADIFENFFGGARAQSARRERGEDREVEITLSLLDVVADQQRMVELRRFEKCATCEGTGAEPGSAVITCPTCGGTGQVTRVSQSFFGTIQQRSICAECRGSGKVPEKPCRTCGGEGRVQAKSEVTITIPAGIEDGQTLRLRASGDAGRRGEASGDLFVLVRVTPDPRFEREGADIRSRVTVSVLDAILGAEVNVDTVRGSVTLHVPDGTQPGQVLRIKGKGLPVLSSSRSGDHYVTVDIDIPKKLSREERRIVEEWRRLRA